MGYNSHVKFKTAFTLGMVTMTVVGAGLPLQSEPAGVEAESLANLAFSESLGRVESRYTGESNRWIVHIQDVHAHFAAQENIAAIVDHLNAVYGIKTVALEGGWSATSLPKSWSIPTSREKQMLARALLEEDHITGPVYAALFSPLPIMLVGIEDPELYEQNRQVYLEHLARHAEIVEKLDALMKNLTAEKEQVDNPDLLALDRELVKFREGEKAEGFLPVLISMAKGHEVPMTDLAQIQIFLQVLLREESIDQARLEAEAARLMKEYKKSRLSFEELLRSGKIPADQLKFYPTALIYHEMIQFQDQLIHQTFFQEVEELIRRLKDQLFSSPEEKALDLRSERFLLAKKILMIQATPENLMAFEAQAEAIRSELTQANLEHALEIALKFYEIAKKRDETFAEKIATDPRLAGNIAVVTGGFHTEGLSQQLLENKVSHLVVSPDLAGEAPNHELYTKRLEEELVSAQTLSELRNRVLTEGLESFDERFARSEIRLKETRNIAQEVEKITAAPGPGTVPGEPQRAPAGGLDLSNFLNFSREDQVTQVRGWLDEIKAGQLPIVVVIKRSALQKLFLDDVGRILWENYMAFAKSNTVGLIADISDILDEEIGVQAKIIRIQPAEEKVDFDQIIQERFKSALQKKTIAVIDAEYKAKGDVLALPAEPISFILARLILERGADRGAVEGIRTLIADLVREIFLQDGLIERAA